ncbi:MAG: methylated-DNA--[protein]-cysteine S-methyltransferase [Rhodoglobus sp.]
MITQQLPPPHLKRVDSPLGRIELGSDGDAITSLTIERDGHLPWEHVLESETAVLGVAARQLDEYFSGRRTQFDLPVVLVGTEFQLGVWHELQQIEFGSVASYGEIGNSLGRAAAGRAVGGAIGANPVPLIVPCHRVLGSDKKITGYSAGNGIPTKTWLLNHEGIEHRS